MQASAEFRVCGQRRSTRDTGGEEECKLNCAICGHRDRVEMVAALEAGETVIAVGARFHVGYSSLWAHWQRHEAKRKEAAAEPPEATLESMARLTDQALRLIEPWALGAGALRIMERRERQIQLAARMRQNEKAEAPPFDLAQCQEWQELKARILLTLERFPDAYQAMLEALERSR